MLILFFQLFFFFEIICNFFTLFRLFGIFHIFRYNGHNPFRINIQMEYLMIGKLGRGGFFLVQNLV